MAWAVIQMDGPSPNIHCVPLDDCRPHDLALDCWCRPLVDDEETDVINHNSMDGREAFERGDRQVS